MQGLPHWTGIARPDGNNKRSTRLLTTGQSHGNIMRAHNATFSRTVLLRINIAMSTCLKWIRATSCTAIRRVRPCLNLTASWSTMHCRIVPDDLTTWVWDTAFISKVLFIRVCYCSSTAGNKLPKAALTASRVSCLSLSPGATSTMGQLY